MIIQEVLKGISGINEDDVNRIFAAGILCNWWRKVGQIPADEIPIRLTDRNLQWHQNRYEDPDPLESNEVFKKHTPFISTTAGSVVRDAFNNINRLQPAGLLLMHFSSTMPGSPGEVWQ